MKELVLEATVAEGLGRYSRLSFPDRKTMPDLPQQWEQAMCPGSLNARIINFPREMSELGDGYGIQRLDNKRLRAAAIVPFDMIENNSLKPNQFNEERGNAQIWPCEVEVDGTTKTFNAWAVRRIGSAYSDVLELMSPDKLREKHGLENGTKIKIRVMGQGA
jgi:hypothetical protein